jgi:hypothetical protein
MSRADVMAGRSYVSLYVKRDLLTRGLQAARADVNKFGSDMMAIGGKMTAAGTAMLTPIAAAVKLASDFEESFSKFSVVFGESSKRVKQWSDDFAFAVGRSRLQITQFMASTQDLFVPIGFEPGAAEELSKQITGLAVDLASFNNMQDADTLRDLHAALTGSGEVMKKYGVLVSEAAVKQQLLNQAIDPAKATEMQKVQARLTIIMAGTTAAQGDAIRTAGSFANQLKALQSELTNVAVEVGTAVLPSLSKMAQTMTGVVRGITAAARANPEAVVTFAALASAVTGTGIALIAVGVAAKVAAAGFGILISGISIIKGAVSIALGGIRLFRAATVGLATLMQGAFAASATASAVAVTALAAAESASIITLVPYTAGLITAANATAVLGITSGATTTALIAASGAMALATTGNVGLITSSAGASGGLITLSGSAAVASAGVAGVSASAGIMATAFTAASGVIGAAWGIILGPLTPFILAAGTVVAVITGITAAATVATVRAMDFSKAWTIAKDTLSAVITIAKQVGGILMTALQQGDYDVAFKASMAGVKLVFATLVDSMGQMWETFWDGAWKSVKTFMSEFAKLSSKVVVAVAKAIANPVTGQYELSKTIQELTKDINLSFSIDTKGMASKAKTELDKLEKELADRQAKRDAEDKAKADAEAAAGASDTPPGPNGEGSAFGDQSAAQMDGAAAAEEAKSAFDRETESIREQIIALREGEEAAERFRLSKQGLTDAEIEQVMALRKEQEAMEKEQENARRIVERIQDYADAEADNKDNKLTPAEIAAKEKAAIELNRKSGRIDAQTAAEAMAEADVRQAEREHQERLKKLRGEGVDATFGQQSYGLKSGGASAATFSAQSLLSMGSGAGQNSQLKALIDTKKSIEFQTQMAKEQSDAQIAAIKQTKMKHA